MIKLFYFNSDTHVVELFKRISEEVPYESSDFLDEMEKNVALSAAQFSEGASSEEKDALALELAEIKRDIASMGQDSDSAPQPQQYKVSFIKPSPADSDIESEADKAAFAALRAELEEISSINHDAMLLNMVNTGKSEVQFVPNDFVCELVELADGQFPSSLSYNEALLIDVKYRENAERFALLGGIAGSILLFNKERGAIDTLTRNEKSAAYSGDGLLSLLKPFATKVEVHEERQQQESKKQQESSSQARVFYPIHGANTAAASSKKGLSCIIS